MLEGQFFKAFADGVGADFHAVVASGKGTQGRGDEDGHFLPRTFSALIQEVPAPMLSVGWSSIAIVSFSKCLSSSVEPASRNEFVTFALPCSTDVMT
jgi:hypothetical protein